MLRISFFDVIYRNMKLRKPTKNEPVTSEKTTQTKLENGRIEIYHSQEYKLSVNYQTSGAHYGVKLICEDDNVSINETIRRAQNIVEPPLKQKVVEQRKFLDSLCP